MTGWPELLATALVGTDRRGAATDEAARGLLDEAAGWAAYRRAGVRPGSGLPAPEAAPAETRPLVGPAAGDRLDQLLDPFASGVESTVRLALVEEWLSTVVERGRRIPGELLPELFETVRRQSGLRRLAVTAAGSRATWLAGLNPEWTFLTATPDVSAAADPAAWHEGTPGQRAGYLAARRRDDPAAARELLAAEWPGLAPDERAQLLPILADGLGPDDEAFLERALDDRRREVRTAAVALLAELPGSSYQARMAERARACLSVQRGRLVVTPPLSFEPELRRDGLEPRPPGRIGERAWWLRQILARAPLPEQVAPLELLSTVEEWGDELLRGLALAACEQRHAGWAAVLLDALQARSKPGDGDWELVTSLYPALPLDELHRRAVAGLAAGDARVAWLLPEIPAPWPDELSAAALAGFEAAARAGRAYGVTTVAHTAGLRMAPSFAAAAGAAADRLLAEQNNRFDAFERLAAILRLRHEMIQEIG